MGFTAKWVTWIMGCLSSVSFSLLLNGQPSGYIIPSPGLRQGDPLSPYLFLLCAERFSETLRHAESQNSIHGLRVFMGAPPISHLLFADDTLVFCKARRSEIQAVGAILDDNRWALGQFINFQRAKYEKPP